MSRARQPEGPFRQWLLVTDTSFEATVARIITRGRNNIVAHARL